MQTRPVAQLCLAATLTLGLAGTTRAAVVLFDQFGSPSYDDSSITLGGPDDLSTATAFGSGDGNPPPGYLVTHFHEVDPDGGGDPFVGVQSLIEDLSVTYTPTIDGTISSILFSLDILYLDTGSEGGEFSDLFFVVHEPGGGGSAGGFTNISPSSSWQTIQVTLTQADFPGRDFAGSNALGFGFGFVSNGFLDGVPDEILEVTVDGFVVDINPSVIPEPSALLLVALALGAVGRRRLPL